MVDTSAVRDEIVAHDAFVRRRRQAMQRDETAPAWALALSGGGIRSATVALGTLQALAQVRADAAGAAQGGGAPASFRDSLLARFDLLATVSGGGYIGAFLCSLFIPGRLGGAVPPGIDPRDAAADDALRVLQSQPPQRLGTWLGKAPPRDRHAAPLAWLRENGRYLAPTGSGDYVYAAAIALRNWLAVHYVVGTALLALFAIAAALLAAGAPTRDLDAMLFERARDAYRVARGATIAAWWSPLLALPAAAFLLGVVPCGLAYWIPMPVPPLRAHAGVLRRIGHLLRRIVTPAALGHLGAALVLAASAAALAACRLAEVACTWPARWPQDARVPVLAYAALVLLLGVAVHVWNAARGGDMRAQRARASRLLSSAFLATIVLALLALIDSAGRTLYLAVAAGAMGGGTIGTFGAAIALLVKASRSLAMNRGSDAGTKPGWLQSLPWSMVGGFVGVAVFALLAAGWASIVCWVQWQGRMPDVRAVLDAGRGANLALFAAGIVLLVGITGRFPNFINLSSLQSFYSARLTRAYLGASNAARFPMAAGGAAMTGVAAPMADDTIAWSQYVGAAAPTTTAAPAATPEPATRAPLHLVLVTCNDTLDPAGQLVQRDRKGVPVVASPLGVASARRLVPYRTSAHGREIELPLHVGQWIGTSGAAFSTGIGRETTLGMSLLMGAANVRLGTWWRSRLDTETARSHPVAWLMRALFTTQTYLAYELTARFHGLRRRWQYLSDGGHFENTGLYELLRDGRGVRLVLACDNGADPEYRFEDLANLMRLVRIDFGVEVEVDASVNMNARLASVFGTPQDFGRRFPLDADIAREPVALLLRARRGGAAADDTWIVLMKPRVVRTSASDVVEYARRHPAFPQQPTADQFFDEAQWESYRKLGFDNARRVLDAAVWGALMAHIAAAS